MADGLDGLGSLSSVVGFAGLWCGRVATGQEFVLSVGGGKEEEEDGLTLPGSCRGECAPRPRRCRLRRRVGRREAAARPSQTPQLPGWRIEDGATP